MKSRRRQFQSPPQRLHTQCGLSDTFHSTHHSSVLSPAPPRYQELQDNVRSALCHCSHVRFVRSPVGEVVPRDTPWVNVEFTAHEPWIVIVL
ncbi:hypothetical protein M405DRAFT_822438 [Rhizopogon salebrosus TDB-379]|nr:hypothetical protein M405DRAFT_822438 [Rhizopogon salebrosus TDB-379]